jgi:hypothetical protein
MTSQVNDQLTNYDANYPVAGQDNDTVKFRLNFAAIQAAFNQTNTELTSLQNNTAKTNANTDFNGSTISNAFTNSLYGTVATINATSGDIAVTTASYFVVSNITGNLTYNLVSWPTSGTGSKEYRFRIELQGTTGNEITFTSSPGILRDTSGSITGSGGVHKVILESNKPTVLEFWRVGAAKVFMKYLGKFQE